MLRIIIYMFAVCITIFTWLICARSAPSTPEERRKEDEIQVRAVARKAKSRE